MSSFLFISSLCFILSPTLFHSPFHVIFMEWLLCVKQQEMSMKTRYKVREELCPLVPFSKHLMVRGQAFPSELLHGEYAFSFSDHIPKNAQDHKSEGCPMTNNLLGLGDSWTVFPRNEGWINGQSLLKLSVRCLRLEFSRLPRVAFTPCFLPRTTEMK